MKSDVLGSPIDQDEDLGRPGQSKQIEVERLRLLKAKADQAEITVAVQMGRLIPREQVEAALCSAATTMKNKLTALAASLSPELSLMTDTAEIEQLLSKKHSDVLRELSQLKGVPRGG